MGEEALKGGKLFTAFVPARLCDSLRGEQDGSVHAEEVIARRDCLSLPGGFASGEFHAVPESACRILKTSEFARLEKENTTVKSP